jgi:small subunit ribosomal protein S17
MDTATTKRRPIAGVKTGFVVGDKRDKTRTVEVSFPARHRKYGKSLRRKSRYHVHDDRNESHLGDKVEIANCHPISKTKSWRLLRVVTKAAGAVEHTVAPEGVVGGQENDG